jgi:hypothetical protein
MRNLVTSFFLLLLPFLGVAHNPLSARYYLEAGEKGSVLSIFLSQDGVNKAMKETYGEDKIKTLDTKGFKELIVDYIKQKFDFSVNGQAIVLQEGGIKLGSHQTDLKFVLPPLPQPIESMVVDIPAFQENKNHQTIFSYTIYGKRNKVILGKNNNYMSEIIWNKVKDVNPNQWKWLTGGATILVVLALGSLAWKRRTRQ